MPLGSDIVEEIVQRTDGVPLFVEELTKAVLERAERDNRVAAVLSASPLPALAVPATLHASLIARLDRIGPAAREMAQIGAVLGREFSYELIAPVAERSAAELRTALTRLGGGAHVLPWHAAPRRISVQARARAGRRLRHVAARPAPGIARARRGGPRATVRRSRRARAGTPRPSFDGSRRYNSRRRSMAEGGSPCGGPVSPYRGDRPFR